MKKSVMATLAVAVIGFVALAQAADEKASPVGTWKFSQAGRGGNGSTERTLKLKVDGEKLTGTVTTGMDNTETDISDGKFKDNEVTFSVVVERNGNKRTTKYNGKLDKDTIKGKVETERQGEKVSNDWEAKREKK